MDYVQFHIQKKALTTIVIEYLESNQKRSTQFFDFEINGPNVLLALIKVIRDMSVTCKINFNDFVEAI